MQYSYIPPTATFKRDSSVSMARRTADPVLARIDNLLDFYQARRFATEPEAQLYALAALTDLFMATRYWIRLAADPTHHSALKPERLPAVKALHGAVVARLGQEIGGDDQAVAEFVRDFKCRSMTDHGKVIDDYEGPDTAPQTPVRAYYFKTARRAATAVRFRNGVAYRLGTHEGQKGRLVKLNSADFESRMQRGKLVSLPGWAPFAMGPEGDLYMTRHFIDENDEGNEYQEKIYHSNYTGGGPLIAAGTMLVVDGKILALRGDSGHYKPSDHNIAEALRVLATRGVDVPRIKIYDWREKNPRPTLGAMRFIREQRQEFFTEVADKKKAAIQRQALGGHQVQQLPPQQQQQQVVMPPSVASVHLNADHSMGYMNI